MSDFLISFSTYTCHLICSFSQPKFIKGNINKVLFLRMYCVYCQEKAMAPHSSTLAWKIQWTEEPVRLQSMGSLRVGQD